jgi:hypothetical protein
MAGPTQIFTKKAQVFVIEESATDTYLVQTAGSGFMAEITDAPLTIDGENYTPEQARGDFLSMDETPGTISASMSFRVAMRGGGAATTPPEFGEAIKACGFLETTNAGDVTYTPTSTYDGVAGNPGQSYSVTVLEESGITPSSGQGRFRKLRIHGQRRGACLSGVHVHRGLRTDGRRRPGDDHLHCDHGSEFSRRDLRHEHRRGL